MLNSSKPIVVFNARELLASDGPSFTHHNDDPEWERMPGCCTANVLYGLPDIECVKEFLQDWKNDIRKGGGTPENISANKAFREVWRAILDTVVYTETMGVMTLVQTQHNQTIRRLLKQYGWKKCGQRVANSGNTVSLWGRFT